MNPPSQHPPSRAHPVRSERGGFTIVEVVISVVIVGVLLAASLRAVGLSRILQYRTMEQTRANEMARALLAEIGQKAYADPGAAPVFGPESGETRAAYDDVDDYDGFAEHPPLTREGTKLPLPSSGSWRWSVDVKWVDAQTLAVASPQSETGAKQVTVTVTRNNVPLAKVSLIRTAAP